MTQGSHDYEKHPIPSGFKPILKKLQETLGPDLEGKYGESLSELFELALQCAAHLRMNIAEYQWRQDRQPTRGDKMRKILLELPLEPPATSDGPYTIFGSVMKLATKGSVEGKWIPISQAFIVC